MSHVERVSSPEQKPALLRHAVLDGHSALLLSHVLPLFDGG